MHPWCRFVNDVSLGRELRKAGHTTAAEGASRVLTFWPRYAFAARFLARARAAPRPPVSIRRRRVGATGTVRRDPIETVARVTFSRVVSRAREGGASATGFDPAAPARSYGDCSARADRNRWQRGGGCGGCALWHFRLARSCS